MGHLHLQIIYNFALKSSNTENVFHHEESARQEGNSSSSLKMILKYHDTDWVP